MADITSTATGDFDAGATWVGGTPPAAGDNAIIAAGHTVTTTQDQTITDLTIAATGVLVLWDSVESDFVCSGSISVSGTLTCNASTCSFGSGITTSTYSIWMNVGGVFNGGSGTHTIGTISSTNATSFILSSGITTLDSAKTDSSNIAMTFSQTSFDDGNGTLSFTYAGDQILWDTSNTARTLYNVVLNKASGVVQYYDGKGFALTIANDLTITSGEFDASETVSGTSRDITVTGAVSISGTLTGNASAISMGSLTITGTGTYDATSGTTTIKGNIDIDGTLTMGAGGYIECGGNFDIDGTWGDTNYYGTLVMTGTSKTIESLGTSYGLENLVINSAGTVTLAGELSDCQNVYVIEGTLDTSGTDYAVGTFSNGNIFVSEGATLTANGSTITINGTGNFQNSGGFIGRSAFEGDGAEHITISDHANLDVTNISIEAIIRTSAVSDYIIDRDTNFEISIDGSGNIVGNITATGTATVTSTSTVNDGVWHHIAMTYDGTTTKLYIDGKLEATDTTASGNIGATAEDVLIASDNAGASEFDGEIAMIRMWNDARTQAEILSEMFHNFGGLASSTGLIFMFQFDEAAGTTVDNIETTAALDGTLTAANWIGSGTYSGASASLVMGTGDMILLDATVYGSGTPSDVIEMGGSSAVVGYTFDSSADVTLNNSGNLVSDDHNTTGDLMHLIFTSLSYANMKVKPNTSSDIILVAGTWTLGSTADNDDYGDLTINSGTIIQLVTFCDIYVDSFTNNGTWNRVGPYTGMIHVGALPFETSHILDANPILDNILDSINIIQT